MKSFTTSDFWNAYAALPPEVKKQARKSYSLWKQDQFYPSLHFKKVEKNLWSARLSSGYRVLALKQNDDYYWFWIGSHDEYEKLIG